MTANPVPISELIRAHQIGKRTMQGLSIPLKGVIDRSSRL